MSIKATKSILNASERPIALCEELIQFFEAVIHDAEFQHELTDEAEQIASKFDQRIIKFQTDQAKDYRSRIQAKMRSFLEQGIAE